MIRFTLLGVEVYIRPSLWLMLLALGVGCVGVTRVPELCTFVVAAFCVVFFHEMGHAWVSRMFAGGKPVVHLTCLGGDCAHEEARMRRWQGALMTAAGPVSSLLLCVMAGVGVGMICGWSWLEPVQLYGVITGQTEALLESVSEGRLLLMMSLDVVACAFWWMVLNILPIFPLDGGKMMFGLMHSPKKMHGISLWAAGVMMAVFATMGIYSLCVFMLVLAWLNYRCRNHAPF